MKFRDYIKFRESTEDISSNFDQIMRQTWGCGGSWFRKMFLHYNCQLDAGRTLTVKFFPSHPISEDGPMAEINFYQNVPNQSQKDQDLEYQANKTLQAGTMDFLNRLKKFVTLLHPLGVWIQYTTDARRDRLYDRVITQAGYKKADMGVYRP
jgi:hypothetical protein